MNKFKLFLLFLLIPAVACAEWMMNPYSGKQDYYQKGAAFSNLTDLMDVSVVSPNLNDILVFNGTHWVNQAPSASGYVNFTLNETADIGWGYNFTTSGNITANWFLGNISDNISQQRIVVYNGTVLVGKQSELRFKAGSNISLGIVNDTTDGIINITISSSGGGGAGGYENFTNNETQDINWSYNFTANAFFGDGGGLTNLSVPWANITGAPTIYENFTNNETQDISWTHNFTTTGDIQAQNLKGNLTADTAEIITLNATDINGTRGYFTGQVQANSFSGDGYNLTNLNITPNITQGLLEFFKDGVSAGINNGISFNISPSITWSLINDSKHFNVSASMVANSTQELIRVLNSSTSVGVNSEINFIQGQNMVLAITNDTTLKCVNVTISANNSTGGAGGYVNFTTNETADIVWAHNLSVIDLNATRNLIVNNTAWIGGNLSVNGNYSYQIDNITFLHVHNNGTNLFGGLNAGKSISNTGVKNTVWGNDAGASLDRGSENLLIGYRAGTNISNVSSFIAIGAYALEQKNNGQGSIGIGYGALRQEDAGTNALCGYLAGANITNGTANSGFGNRVLVKAINASQNSVWGDGGFVNCVNCLENTGVGQGVGNPLIDGRGNAFFGKSAGVDIVNGSYNIRLGTLSSRASALVDIGYTFLAHYGSSDTPFLEGNMTEGDLDWIRSWADWRVPTNNFIYFGTGTTTYTTGNAMGNVSMRWNAGEPVAEQRFEFDCQPTAILGSNFTVTADEPDTYTLQLKNEATVWNDQRWMTVWTPAEVARRPSRVVFMNRTFPPPVSVGVEAWRFDPNEPKDLHFNWEFPHDYMEQTNIMPHIHWSAELDQPGTNVVWELEYTCADPGMAFPNPTTVITVVAPVSGTKIHEHTFFPDPIPGGLIERVCVCRIGRKADDEQDNYAGNAFLHITGYKYEANTLGSRAMTTK